jgi:hypothetical protein
MRQARQTGNGCRFNPEEIRAIRKEYDTLVYHGRIRDLAIKYNCHPGLMWSICKRRLYKWVEEN